MLNFVIGAALGGFSGWRIGKAQGATGWNLAGYIFAGAAIGTLTAGIGETVAAATASWGTVGSGIATGVVAGAVNGGFSSALSGGNFGQGLWQGALYGGLTGGLFAVAGDWLGNSALRTYMRESSHRTASIGGDAIAFERLLPQVTIRRSIETILLESFETVLKSAALVPLLTLALVLKPTQLGSAYRTITPLNELYGNQVFSKGGKQNIWDDQVSPLSDAELKDLENAAKSNKNSKLQEKIKTEWKRRGNANKQKRQSRGY